VCHDIGEAFQFGAKTVATANRSFDDPSIVVVDGAQSVCTQQIVSLGRHAPSIPAITSWL
jgi:hypothetical protein